MGTLWHGGNIYTLQQENEQVEAIYTDGGVIIEIGSYVELLEKYKNNLDLIEDLKGATMLPGFVDSHMHLIGHGERLIRLDLSKCTSKGDVLAAVKEYSLQFPAGEWIVGEGWNENLWEDPSPITSAELDLAVPDHPVLLKRVCRHALTANSLALKLAGITETTDCPPGGVIELDDQGQINGILKDQAQDLLFSAVPPVTKAYLKKALQAAITDAYSLGLTGSHTEDLNYYNGFEHTYEAIKEVIEEDQYNYRAHLLVHHEVVDDMIASGQHFMSGTEWVEFGAMKIFADGALGGRTALLSHPYADDETTSGVAIFSQELLDELVKKAREYNLPVAVHAIGDLAFEMVVNSIEKYPLIGKGRDRLIHAQILRKELIDRIKNLPLILDIQPRFVASDFPWVVERVGQEYMNYCYAWKTLLDEGLHCAGGSDAPIEPVDPRLGIHAAVTRTNIDSSDCTVYNEEERLTVYEAVSLFTKGSAYAISHEHDRGVIKKGNLADFTILEENIFTIAPEAIASIPVKQTVIGGKTVYRNEIGK
ncbi:amidohydrolase [Cytobacillus gottheilii]|uniref:Amidohydrolase n=1 Tax=Cytobacillus gottheilii TaxID=859144 RepID=A0ABX8FAV1_9BACI|nr:amidohydrolase [Cytobacillus gottheilii]QVY60682.1 amidohydrolase [Cytobacillus gottheilii]